MEYRSPVCRARICRKSPLMFQHPSFILARRNNRHHFRVSSRVMPMPPGYTKVFGFAPTWCTKKCLTRKCRAFFYCSILRRHDLVQRRRYSKRAAARSAVRNATARHSLARGRVPGNVAGVERRGDGERQGLEIKKCKFARGFMATISLMVVCCEIFSIEENWGKRRGEGTPPYGWGRVRCGFLMCGTAGRGVVG